MDRWDMSEVACVGQRHGQVERSHGQGRDQVALEHVQFVLLNPRQTRDVVGDVPAIVSTHPSNAT